MLFYQGFPFSASHNSLRYFSLREKIDSLVNKRHVTYNLV